MRNLKIALLTTCVIAGVFLGMKRSDPPGKQMKVFADSFLSTLEDEQKSIALMPYDSPKRVDWHFIPKKNRKGLVLSDMNEAQRTAAMRLVRAALSEAGYDKTSKIMMLEGVLREMEGEGRNWARDPEMYYVTLFGQPSDSEAWGLSFEGHHVSLNFVCRDGRVVDSTPQFFASNPSIVKNEVSGPLGKGTRVLRDEEAMAFRFVNDLSSEQLKKALIAEEAPAEIRFAGEAQAVVGDPEGIAFSDLRLRQQAALKRLVDVYVSAVAEPIAKERREMIRQSGWKAVHFAWAGAREPGIGHYYRIRGEKFLIEFVNTQADPAGNPANHIHCVWRDLTGDFDLSIE